LLPLPALISYHHSLKFMLDQRLATILQHRGRATYWNGGSIFAFSTSRSLTNIVADASPRQDADVAADHMALSVCESWFSLFGDLRSALVPLMSLPSGDDTSASTPSTMLPFSLSNHYHRTRRGWRAEAVLDMRYFCHRHFFAFGSCEEMRMNTERRSAITMGETSDELMEMRPGIRRDERREGRRAASGAPTWPP